MHACRSTLEDPTEYPLWYSYFLLPAAWAWGFALQPGEPLHPGDSPDKASWPNRLLVAAAAAVVAGAVFSVWDYLRVAAIFTASDDSPPLAQRIADGQRSLFFAHHADYAAVTAGLPVADPERAFDRATHYLLDTRLMTAWAVSLAERGELDKARHLAQRLREFRKAESEEFFAACHAGPAATSAQASAPVAAEQSPSGGASAAAAASAKASAVPASAAGAASAVPFQCQPPLRELSWREFLPAGR